MPAKASRQKSVEPACLGFAREERNAKLLRLADFRRDFGQHRETARDVEAADGDLKVFGAENPGKVDGARELVRLHADHADHASPPASRIIATISSGRMRVLVSSIGVQPDFDVGAEDVALRGVLAPGRTCRPACSTELRSETIDRIAFIIVMGGFDQNDIEDAGGGLGDRLGRHSHPLAKARQLLFSLKIFARL